MSQNSRRVIQICMVPSNEQSFYKLKKPGRGKSMREGWRVEFLGTLSTFACVPSLSLTCNDESPYLGLRS